MKSVDELKEMYSNFEKECKTKLTNLVKHFGKYEFKEIICFDDSATTMYLDYLRYDTDNKCVMVGLKNAWFDEKVEKKFNSFDLTPYFMLELLKQLEKDSNCETTI